MKKLKTMKYEKYDDDNNQNDVVDDEDVDVDDDSTSSVDQPPLLFHVIAIRRVYKVV